MAGETAVLFVKWQSFLIYLLEKKDKNIICTSPSEKKTGWVVCFEPRHKSSVFSRFMS